jgi:hypothetical protein
MSAAHATNAADRKGDTAELVRQKDTVEGMASHLMKAPRQSCPFPEYGLKSNVSEAVERGRTAFDLHAKNCTFP